MAPQNFLKRHPGTRIIYHFNFERDITTCATQ